MGTTKAQLILWKTNNFFIIITNCYPILYTCTRYKLRSPAWQLLPLGDGDPAGGAGAGAPGAGRGRDGRAGVRVGPPKPVKCHLTKSDGFKLCVHWPAVRITRGCARLACARWGASQLGEESAHDCPEENYYIMGNTQMSAVSRTCPRASRPSCPAPGWRQLRAQRRPPRGRVRGYRGPSCSDYEWQP